MRKLIFIACGILAFNAAIAAPMTFVIDDPGGRNLAQFASKATIENIAGNTNAVTGSVTFDPSDLKKPVSAHIEVDLRKVDTGIAMRNEHMRSENYLNTDKYPSAVFSIDTMITTAAKIATENQATDVTLRGWLEIHGAKRQVSVTGKAIYLKANPDLDKMGYPGEMLNFDGNFRILLSDFNITRPQMLVLKLAEEQDIHINFTATTGRKPIEAKP
jgi:polyisoprenoid-binding protein YceI